MENEYKELRVKVAYFMSNFYAAYMYACNRPLNNSN